MSVYVAEAHAADEWKLGSELCYLQPKTLEQRLRIAKDFIANEKFAQTLVVDLMNNNAAAAYNAIPERIFVIQDGKIVYSGGRGPHSYLLSEAGYWLEQSFPNAK